MAQCTRSFRDMYNMVLKAPLLVFFVWTDNVIPGIVPKGDKDCERWHPTVRDGSAQRDHGKRSVGFKSPPVFRIRGAKHPPQSIHHRDDNNLTFLFALRRFLSLFSLHVQRTTLGTGDVESAIDPQFVVAAPSTSLLIANPPAVPIVSSARQCLTNKIGRTLNPDWDDNFQQIAYAVSIHPCLPRAKPRELPVNNEPPNISPDHDLTDSCGFKLPCHAVSGYGSGTPALDRTFLVLAIHYPSPNDNARRPINSRNAGRMGFRHRMSSMCFGPEMKVGLRSS
ncbi:uncharacterized protein BO96DRAFT_343302 [Aspergillus niger CBS 101883]|uniref:Uncharacterized protein n=2 Tax=Aspergillus niger TaxID=5061 RepID=A2R4U3_ASPNC|nr:uncharacterized protein BO96DRAFT_343302 [Aspergillus niger CBS 101883]XP_059607030.1 hypothetical protein An15g01610 [Aspergillus niger]PYH54301.1 hypothetical protein BO96DRAFT_343302 [Aspergillus niger CBS 101883]CAL00975.1 hypothetical protein An15g01610 [Aspergillus niger]